MLPKNAKIICIERCNERTYAELNCTNFKNVLRLGWMAIHLQTVSRILIID